MEGTLPTIAPLRRSVAAPLPFQQSHPHMSLSVIIITRNEAQHIAACLASVAFADEWIVVDSGSTDDTREIATAHGARVIETTDWPGYGPQKNRALAAATGEWIFSIDADERVTPALAAQIRTAITRAEGTESGAPSSYTVSRLSAFCGIWMRHGDWYPDHVLRLFRRSHGRFTDDRVHEHVAVRGPVGHLDAHLLHDSMPSLESCLDKMNRYSSGRALDRHAAGHSGSLGKALGHGLWAFLRSYVVKRGFLDGRMGFIVALNIAEGTYYRYLKLWLLGRPMVSPLAPPSV
jgi:glycosyltransferase involved in cell wall biosynthesis